MLHSLCGHNKTLHADSLGKDYDYTQHLLALLWERITAKCLLNTGGVRYRSIQRCCQGGLDKRSHKASCSMDFPYYVGISSYQQVGPLVRGHRNIDMDDLCYYISHSLGSGLGC